QHRSQSISSLTRIRSIILVAAIPACAGGQTLEGVARPAPAERTMTAATSTPISTPTEPVEAPRAVRYEFRSRADSLSWSRARALARRATGLHLVVSLQDRRLWAIADDDTLLDAPVAVAKGTTLEYAGREWKFSTPRGIRTVLSKESDPIWQPPD